MLYVILAIVVGILYFTFIVGRHFERDSNSKNIIKEVIRAKEAGISVDSMSRDELIDWVYQKRK